MPFDTACDGLTENDIAHLAQADAAIEHLKNSRVPQVRGSDYPGMASWGLASYRQVWLFRIVQLADGLCAEWNARRLITASVLLRSMIETVGALNHVLDHGYTLLQKGDIRAFHDRVMKGMFGSNETQLVYPDMPGPTNVLTVIDRLDKTFKGVRKHYDLLSEMVHPNAAGTLAFGVVDFEQQTLQLGEVNRDSTEVVYTILPGLAMLEFAQRIYQASETQIMPLVVELEARHGGMLDQWPTSGA